MTLAKLAELVGVSVSTVSKAFSGSHEISEETRERIYSVAKKEGCYDKYYKGKRKRPLVALIYPESESEYYAREIGIFEKEIFKRGADTLVAFAHFDPERVESFFRELAYNTGVDGIIVRDCLRKLRNPDGIPLAVIGSKAANVEYANRFTVDFESAIRDLVGTLKDFGHNRIGFIGDALTNLKLSAFKSAMRYHGLPIHEKFIAVSKKRFAEAGEEGMKAILRSDTKTTVVLCGYDNIAYGAMSCVTSMGISVPTDMSFVGIDDLTINNYSPTGLTSLRVCVSDFTEKIIESLFRRIEGKSVASCSVEKIPITLVIRDTLAKIDSDGK